MTERFASPGSRAEVEEGATLTPRFGPDGLIACVATDARTGRCRRRHSSGLTSWASASAP